MFHQEEDFATKNFDPIGLHNGHRALEIALFMNLSSTQQKNVARHILGQKFNTD